MLDEIGELRLYTSAPENNDSGVSRQHLLVYDDAFRCIPHAMTTIARWCLYGEDGDWEKALENVDDTIKLLRHWAGFADAEEPLPAFPRMEACENWMSRFIDAYCKRYENEKKAPNKKALEGEWSKLRKNYERAIFSSRGIALTRANAFSYQKAIAQALRMGPLKRRCLVGKLVPDETCTSSTLKKDGTSYRSIDRRTVEYVPLLTALCLLGLAKDGGVPRSEFISLNKREALSWKNAGKDDVNMGQWLYDGEQIFMQREEIAGIKPWMISQKWLDDGQWQLIDITDGEEPLDRFCRERVGEGFKYYIDDLEQDKTALASFFCDDRRA